ncbi:hematological and neurological expressed 1 protein-like isoform X1 [Sinocyclocheilus anshuiensis]|uniref:Hematological and neurological expressed 1 protein-like n=1 Tax=Sinocyclocheilus anshuiensis TaxID=1608454 RepID=A0A671RRR3_9TELE|nr:PREDICTED: hematological and neurological expressed 1 protein-like isoform X1 [Sinocyclocheilus anshuiensis]
MTTTTNFQGMEPGAKKSSRFDMQFDVMSGVLMWMVPKLHPAQSNGAGRLPVPSQTGVLCPPGGASNISFGTEEEKPVRKNKMVSSIFAEPDDPHAHRRNNPPGGEASGVLCGESSAPLRRCQPIIVYDNGSPVDQPANSTDHNEYEQENNEEQKEETAQPSALSAAANPSGRKNPPGGKSSLILG